MLTISDSTVEVSSGTSAILISASKFEESTSSSSVVVNKCSISCEINQFRGLVETAAFPDCGSSRSISIVGCSFNSQEVLGTDGIGLSLTRKTRKNVDAVGTISSSLIGCSFVNMSSIGSSCQPKLLHLSQKMLGCVVSLSSSHLSGSTIRDVNNGGSVLCSNSSFSSLLSSPNTDTDSTQGTVTLPNGTFPFVDNGTVYSFDEQSGTDSSIASFSHCHFTGANYADEVRPLTFEQYPGAVSIISCSFTDFHSNLLGGVVSFSSSKTRLGRVCFTVTSSNFTFCSAQFGAAIDLFASDDVIIDSCRFEHCSPSDTVLAEGGGLNLHGSELEDHIPQFQFVGCVIADCLARSAGAGVSIAGESHLTIVDTKFERCELITGFDITFGGAIGMFGETALTMERSHFIECLSRHGGGALALYHNQDVHISDTLVKNCYSGSTGAICILNMGKSANISFSHVLFDGNSIGNDTTFFPMFLYFGANSTKFTDVAYMCPFFSVMPAITFDDCYTTISTDSTGMIIGRTELETDVYDPERYFHDEFNKIGPLLTAEPTARVNEKTGKIVLEMKGKTPLKSQEYEVTMKEDSNGTETQLRILFSNGTGTMVSESEVSQKYNTGFTITKIVGVVPASSSSTLNNGIEAPAAAWAFNLAATPSSFISFTTPNPPPCLISASSDLISAEPNFAYVLLVFSEKMKGSFDVVVEEDGKDVTLTVPILTEALVGESPKFVVVGSDRLLTHDTTYTFKSIVPTPGTDSPFVQMNDTITFHIPKSSYVPPEKDEKKSMSPETKKLLSWLIPLVACLLIALLLAIVIIVLLRRRQQKHAVPTQKEMETQKTLEVEKVEELGVDCSHGVIRTDGKDHSAFDSSDDNPTNVSQSEEVNKSGEGEGEYAEVMACSGDFAISAARMDSTLYSVLHKERREIGKRGIEMQIVNGLKHVVAHRGRSDLLTRLSSHWILVDTAGNVQLKLLMNTSEAEQEAACHQRQMEQQQPNFGDKEEEHAKGDDENTRGKSEGDKSGMDGLRWRAPEVVAAEERSGVGSVDGHKASVFSLGLVLWEIETGLVPFGELDAVNAQRQSGIGIGPKMDLLRNEEFATLIHRCVSVDPKERPTLTEIGEFLSSHPENTRIASGKELEEP
ncbi:hypothetical protein BLNAU_9383 [Blattamonas nauphoetae]|uniref:Protein kinase domain-containing protein n=1 Tax=Blattamonas nauphoetae TaxID=2049346 RepID=A0ABQ9XW37_9EUKA|nr:hypothetical protein BLNAU_9383 [Blattamonas nauphoetae]